MVRDAAPSKGVDFSRFTDRPADEHAAVQPVPEHHGARVPRHAPGRASRARAPRPTTAFMDAFAFDRAPAGDARRGTKPVDVTLPPDQADFGLVLNQDVANFRAGPARAAPTRLHPPHALERGVPDHQPAPQPRALPRHHPERDHRRMKRRARTSGCSARSRSVRSPRATGSSSARTSRCSPSPAPRAGEPGFYGERYGRYLAERARGGVGVVIAGQAQVHPTTAYQMPNNAVAWDDESVAALPRGHRAGPRRTARSPSSSSRTTAA